MAKIQVQSEKSEGLYAQTTGRPGMILGDILDTMAASRNLIVRDESGREVYRGYVANFEYSALRRTLPVRHIDTKMETYKRTPVKQLPTLDKEAVALEEVGRYGFYDMEIWIYMEIIVST